ncbi:MAG: stage III sporulation protein AF [Lachnospiraceae bacterium]|nr:stage III sporulation protein AF [Lachnospiraceae bacterium]
MTGIMEWVKNYSMVFLLLTVISSLAAKKEYKQYIQFFVEVLLVVMVVTPFFQAVGRSEEFFDKISYDSFWQELDSIRHDQDKLQFLEDDYYIHYYEETIQADLVLLAEDAGFKVLDAAVKMNEEYRVENMYLAVAKQEENRIIVGSIEKQSESAEIMALRRKIAEYYHLEEENIVISE